MMPDAEQHNHSRNEHRSQGLNSPRVPGRDPGVLLEPIYLLLTKRKSRHLAHFMDKEMEAERRTLPEVSGLQEKLNGSPDNGTPGLCS